VEYPHLFLLQRDFDEKLFGEAGIRTLDTLAGITVFETAAIDHSATSPKFSKNKCPERQNRHFDVNLASTTRLNSCTVASVGRKKRYANGDKHMRIDASIALCVTR
jgi:hypothetical protein